MPHEDPKSIGSWTSATFGEGALPASVAARANEEMAEFLRAVVVGETDKALEEAADVWIVLCHYAAVMGQDLQAEVDRKMAVNRARKWEIRADGTGKHVAAE